MSADQESEEAERIRENILVRNLLEKIVSPNPDMILGGGCFEVEYDQHFHIPKYDDDEYDGDHDVRQARGLQ